MTEVESKAENLLSKNIIFIDGKEYVKKEMAIQQMVELVLWSYHKLKPESKFTARARASESEIKLKAIKLGIINNA